MTLMGDSIEQKINKKKLDKIKLEILQMEDENAKTKNYGYNDMVDKIKQTIKNGVDGKNI